MTIKLLSKHIDHHSVFISMSGGHNLLADYCCPLGGIESIQKHVVLARLRFIIDSALDDKNL